MDQQKDLPLAGVRVIELNLGALQMCGRFLADLGAQVVLVEQLGGLASRQRPPLYQGQSLHFISHNANKLSVELDLDAAAGRQQLGALLDSADIFLDGSEPGWLEQAGLARQLREDLVTLQVSAFGRSGPYAGFLDSNSVQLAMGAVLARSGIKGQQPLLPPGELAYETAALQAAWVVLSAYWNRLNGGAAGVFDFSVYESTLQILDPGMGVTGSAAGGRSALESAPRGRPPVGNSYPIFQCADGAVRICLLNPRQWQGMSSWLGDDHPFVDPAFASLARRFKVIREINALIAELFRPQAVAELVAEGQRRGVPIAAVAHPCDVLSDVHFTARDTFYRVPVADIQGRVPRSFVEVDGVPAGIRQPAPQLGEHTAEQLASLPVEHPVAQNLVARRPFTGLLVLDLGVIVAGAELGRLLADQGAQVIKIESSAYPDGLRQSLDNQPMSISFAQGSRGKRSLGLNLRDAEGVALFKQLAQRADVILSNFKPGTLESLGIGADVLLALNPRLIMADSSALGNHGPLSRSMGYGPLVRASTGLTWLWRYPQQEDGYSDATTIFPDHFAARISAAAICAALVRRARTGLGGRISVCQAETILAAFSTTFLEASLAPQAIAPQGNSGRFDAPSDVFACAGDDEWCVIDVQNDIQWQALCTVLGRRDWLDDSRLATAQGRLACRAELVEGVGQWTWQRAPHEVRRLLQAAGVPAGNMLRLDQMLQDEQLNARSFFRTLQQPGLSGPVMTENGPAPGPLPDPLIRPAPFIGQHTRDIAQELLGLDAAQCDELISRGILEQASEQVQQILAQWQATLTAEDAP